MADLKPRAFVDQEAVEEDMQEVAPPDVFLYASEASVSTLTCGIGGSGGGGVGGETLGAAEGAGLMRFSARLRSCCRLSFAAAFASASMQRSM